MDSPYHVACWQLIRNNPTLSPQYKHDFISAEDMASIRPPASSLGSSSSMVPDNEPVAKVLSSLTDALVLSILQWASEFSYHYQGVEGDPIEKQAQIRTLLLRVSASLLRG
jgi:hypothetical protein